MIQLREFSDPAESMANRATRKRPLIWPTLFRRLGIGEGVILVRLRSKCQMFTLDCNTLIESRRGSEAQPAGD